MTAPFPSLARPERLSDKVVTAIRARILDGAMPPGARLPSENDLSHQLGVSRPIVREGLARLKADGLLESRQGSGIFVAAEPGAAAFKLVEDRAAAIAPRELRDIFELRAIVEVSAAELAAERRTDADLARMRRAIADMDRAIAEERDGSAADAAFHAAIAAATRNASLARFITFLGHSFADSRKPSWTAAGRAAGKAQAAQAEHAEIIDAITARDPERAAAAARRHLEETARRTGLGRRAAARS